MEIPILFLIVSDIQGGIISTISGAIFIVWFLILFMIGIKDGHKLSYAKAIGSITIGVLYLMGIGILISLMSTLFRTYF